MLVAARACLLLAGLAAARGEGEGGEAEGGPVADTPAGRILGSWMQTRAGRRFEAYRGVRYARPPVGELRFQPPVDIVQYPAPVDARAEGPACPLLAPPGYSVDEDCLTVNVYTPGRNRSTPLPVIFFIHPGGFYSMSGRSDLAGPHYLLERGLVLVTINYRLGSLGWLSTGDKWAPGNYGLKDQVAALRWVRRNIGAFGGDPGSVTAAGVSAGAISVVLHTVSDMAKGLFHRGIVISGSAVTKAPTPPHQRALARKQARLVGCPTNCSEAMVACLRNKPWTDFADYSKFFEIGYDPVGIWGPVVEPDCGQQRYLTRDPATAIRRGGMRAVPLIVSRTEDEFSWFARVIIKNATLLARMNAEWPRLAPVSFLLPPDAPAAARGKLARLRAAYLRGGALADDPASLQGLGRLYVDSIMGFPIHRQVMLLAEHSPKPVYYYEFAYVGNHSHWEDPDTNKPIGAMHHDDMLYLFTLPYRYPAIAPRSGDDAVLNQMTAIWYNFARYGDPNPRGDTPSLGALSWPPLSPRQRKLLRVGRALSVQEYPRGRHALWEELYPSAPWPEPSDQCAAA